VREQRELRERPRGRYLGICRLNRVGSPISKILAPNPTQVKNIQNFILDDIFLFSIIIDKVISS
jgi:hypothetical protein